MAALAIDDTQEQPAVTAQTMLRERVVEMLREYYKALPELPTGRFKNDVDEFVRRHGRPAGYTDGTLEELAREVRGELRMEKRVSTDRETHEEAAPPNKASWIREIGIGTFVLAAIGLMWYAIWIKRLEPSWVSLRPYAIGTTAVATLLLLLTFGRGESDRAKLSGRLKYAHQAGLVVLFVTTVLLVVIWFGALVLQDAGVVSKSAQARYAGVWRGTVTWKDEWAVQLMNPNGKIENFRPVHPRSEGTLVVAQSQGGVYNGMSTWTVKNNDTIFSHAAVEAYDFKEDGGGTLKSVKVRAHSRRMVLDGATYGPSPEYTWHFEEVSNSRLLGTMTTVMDGKEILVGNILLERR